MSATKTDESVSVSLATVNASQREKNHKVLQPILTDLIAMGRIIKQLHWNVTGPNFRPIHLHLDEIYAVVEEGIDEVAERMAATGHSPNGTLQYVAKNSELMDVPEGFLPDKEVLLLGEHRIKQCVELIRNRMDEIESVDTVTADMLHQIVAALEKHHWMLEAHRV